MLTSSFSRPLLDIRQKSFIEKSKIHSKWDLKKKQDMCPILKKLISLQNGKRGQDRRVIENKIIHSKQLVTSLKLCCANYPWNNSSLFLTWDILVKLINWAKISLFPLLYWPFAKEMLCPKITIKCRKDWSVMQDVQVC